MLRSVTYTFEISAVDFSGEWVPHKFLNKVFGQLDLKRFEPSDGGYWLTGQLFVETARRENISRLHIRPALFLDIYLLLPTCPLYHINKLKYNKTMCTNERGARDIWTLIFLLTKTWRNRMPAIYCMIYHTIRGCGVHTLVDGWPVGVWTWNITVGFSWSCSSICMRWALNHTWRLVTGLKYLPF